MELGLEGKVALVAAAGRGLGRAVAETLAREGCDLAICSRDSRRIETVAAEIAQRTGRRVLGVAVDLTKLDEIRRFVDGAAQHFGRLHIVVSNAGGPPPGTFDDLDEDDWQRAIPLTLLSAIRLAKTALPHLRAAGWGRLIFLTSVTVKQPIDTLVSSNVLRPGVVGLAKSLATQLAPENITVNVVCPGYFLTERVQELAREKAEHEGTSPEAVYDAWKASIPAGRLGEPPELGDLVGFLASERAAYITGVTLQIDGGLVRSLM